MTQFARPISDISVGGSWTFSSGTTAFNLLDEVVADDADYLVDALIFASDSFRVKLGPVTDPVGSVAHIISARVEDFCGIGNVWQISLYQGVTLIASYVAGDGVSAAKNYTYTLLASEANAISDYTDLRIDVFAVDGAGLGSNYLCSQVFFQVPDFGVVVPPFYDIYLWARPDE